MSSMQPELYGGLRLIWQKDIGKDIDEGSWQDIISDVGKAKNKLIHYKIVHRYYFTPNRLFRMCLTQDNKCWKCNKEGGTFHHVLWDCPMVMPLWKAVRTKFEGWFRQPLPESPQL